VADQVHERLRPLREEVQNLEATCLRPAFHKIVALGIVWAELPSSSVDVIGDAAFAALEEFRGHAHAYMRRIFVIKRERAEHWDDIISEDTNGHLIVSTMDSFVKWRAGEIKGYAHRLLQRLEISLFCMEEFESFDAAQVVAALANVSVKTLLMVGDVHQRVEYCSRGGQRATFSGEGGFDALRFAPYGLEDDGEQYGAGAMGVAQSTTDIQRGSFIVPEARPWYEWCRGGGGRERCARPLQAVRQRRVRLRQALLRFRRHFRIGFCRCR